MESFGLVSSFLQDPGRAPGDITDVIASMTLMSNQFLETLSTTRSQCDFLTLFLQFVGYLVKTNDIQNRADHTTIIDFVRVAQRLLCHEFCHDNPSCIEFTAVFLDPSTKLLQLIPGAAEAVHDELFRQANFERMMQRMTSHSPSLEQFSVFYFITQCGKDEISVDDVIDRTLRPFCDVLERTQLANVSGRHLKLLFHMFFHAVALRRRRDFRDVAHVFVFIVACLSKDASLEKKVAFIEILNDVISLEINELNACLVNVLLERNILSLLENLGCHEQLLNVFSPFFTFLAKSGLLNDEFLVQFWIESNTSGNASRVVTDCLAVLPDDAKSRFLASVSQSQFYQAAASLFEQIALKVPDLSEACIAELFRNLAYGWTYLVSLCKHAEKRVQLFGFLDACLREQDYSVNKISVLSEYLRFCGPEDRIFERGVFWIYGENALSAYSGQTEQGSGSPVFALFAMFYYYLICPQNAELTLDQRVLQNLCERASDKQSYWIFVEECLNRKKIKSDQGSWLFEVFEREELSEVLVRLAAQLAWYGLPDRTGVFWVLKKYINNAPFSSIFEAFLSDFFTRIDCYDIVLDFFRENYETDANVFALVLKFLDFTEGRIDLSEFSLVRHHNTCSKMRNVTVVFGQERRNLRVHTSCTPFAMKNIICAIYNLDREQIDVFPGNNNQFMVHEKGEQKVRMNGERLLSMRLDPDVFYRNLSNPTAGKTCRQILKRIKTKNFREVPDMDENQLLYFSEFLQKHRQFIDGERVRQIILQYKTAPAKQLRKYFQLLADIDRTGRLGNQALNEVIVDKILDAPQYVEPLTAYAKYGKADLDLLVVVFQNITDKTFPVFLRIIRENRLQDRISSCVVMNSADFLRAAQFCYDVFSIVNDKRDFAKTVRELRQPPNPIIVVARCVAGLDVTGDELRNLMRNALESDDPGTRKTALSLAVHAQKGIFDDIFLELITQQDSIVRHENKIARFCGLVNPGCLCYMNSILQQLSSNSAFVNALFSGRQLRSDIEALRNLFVQMNFGVQGVVSPEIYWTEYAKYNADFATYQQEDAIEYFQFLLESAPPACKQLFEGALENVFESLDGRVVSSAVEPFTSIDLPVRDCPNLQEAIKDYFGVETLTGDNQYFDSVTKTKLDVRHYYRIRALPERLVFHLKRFEYDLRTYERHKIDDQFMLSSPITIGGVSYDITGTVLHRGSAEMGHYVSAIHSPAESTWVICDDTRVSPVSRRDVERAAIGGEAAGWSAYLLFFKKSDLQPDQTPNIELAPESLQRAVREANGKEQMRKVLLSEEVLNFLKTADSEVKLNYFLKILCPAKDSEKCHEFKSCVMGLGHLYIRYLEEIIRVASTDLDVGALLIELLLSDFRRPAMFDQIKSLTPEIVKSAASIKWVGQLLLAQNTECLHVAEILLNSAYTESHIPREQLDVTSYLKIFSSFGRDLVEITSITDLRDFICRNPENVDAYRELLYHYGITDEAPAPSPGADAHRLPFSELCALIAHDQSFNLEECGYTVHTFLETCYSTLRTGDGAVRRTILDALFPCRMDRILFFLLNGDDDPTIRRAGFQISQLAFTRADGRFEDTDMIAHNWCTFVLERIGDFDCQENRTGTRYSYLLQLLAWLIQETGVVTADYHSSLFKLHQTLSSTCDQAFHESLLELNRLLLTYGAVTSEQLSHQFNTFFRKCAQMSDIQLKQGIEVFWPSMIRHVARNASTVLHNIFFGQTYWELARTILAAAERSPSGDFDDVIAFTTQLVIDYPNQTRPLASLLS